MARTDTTTGGGGGGISSINGDTTPAQILAAGPGIQIVPGPAGTETISSLGAAAIHDTWANINTAKQASALVEGYYYITDRADSGILIRAENLNELATSALGRFVNPDFPLSPFFPPTGDYSNIPLETGIGANLGNWNAGLAPAANDIVFDTTVNAWYVNLSGVNTATRPGLDYINWDTVNKGIWGNDLESGIQDENLVQTTTDPFGQIINVSGNHAYIAQPFVAKSTRIVNKIQIFKTPNTGAPLADVQVDVRDGFPYGSSLGGTVNIPQAVWNAIPDNTVYTINYVSTSPMIGGNKYYVVFMVSSFNPGNNYNVGAIDSYEGSNFYNTPDNWTLDNLKIYFKVESIGIRDNQVVIWNGQHWAVVNAGAFNGTSPDLNPTAYLSLSKTIAGVGYSVEWDEIGYNFDADSGNSKQNILWRHDKLNNKYDHTSWDHFQWGNPNCSGNVIENGSQVINWNNRGNQYINNTFLNLSGGQATQNPGHNWNNNLISAMGAFVGPDEDATAGLVAMATLASSFPLDVDAKANYSGGGILSLAPSGSHYGIFRLTSEVQGDLTGMETGQLTDGEDFTTSSGFTGRVITDNGAGDLIFSRITGVLQIGDTITGNNSGNIFTITAVNDAGVISSFQFYPVDFNFLIYNAPGLVNTFIPKPVISAGIGDIIADVANVPLVLLGRGSQSNSDSLEFNRGLFGTAININNPKIYQ